MSDGHHHRSLFSSKNRPYKGKSKGKIERLNRGKVDSSSHLASVVVKPSNRSSFSSTATSASAGTHRIPIKHSIELATKEQRQLRAKQLQRKKREDLFQKKRIGNRQGPPKIVALIPLGSNVDLTQIVQHVQTYADSTQEGVAEEMKKVEKSTNPLIQSIAVNMSGRQRRITLYSTPRDTNAVLDIAKVADIIMFVLGTTTTTVSTSSGQHGQEDIDVDAFGTHVLAILKAQGMPAVMGIQVGVAGVPVKKQSALRKLASRYFDTACGPDTKVLPMDSLQDAAGFFRWIASDVKLKPIMWRDARPYMLGEQVAFEVNAPITPSFVFSTASTPAPAAETEQKGTLRIRGYLRGENPLSVNQLVHITGYGDFQISKIEGRTEESAVYMSEKEKKQSRAASKAASKMVSRRGSIDNGDAMMMDSSSVMSMPPVAPISSAPSSAKSASEVVLATADPAEQDTLDGLVPLDPFAGEQSIIEDDELLDDGEYEDEDGMDEHKGEYDDDDDDDDMDDAPASSSAPRVDRSRDISGTTIESGRPKKFNDHLPAPLQSRLTPSSKPKPGAVVKSQVAWDDAVPADEDDEDDEEGAEADGAFNRESMNEDDDDTPDIVEKRKLERDELEFPDEVEFPMNTQCRERFARYRGLKSFQNSYWDSKENLPLEYGQIFQFANFEASKNRVLKDAVLGEGVLSEDNSVLPQRFYPISVYLKDVPISLAKSICSTLSPIALFGVFKYEHKVSVMHLSVKRAHEYSAPIKAKEPLEFHVAFRRFVARPIYSEEGKSDKSMTKRFFQQGDFMVASVYARIVFPPASVIAFKPNATVSSLMVGNHPPGALKAALFPHPLTTASTPFTPIVASGTVLTINPDRLLIKRIILTGTPISVHKRNAVIRHMFFNAEDVRWFKPVELTTKYGLVGHIKESRGTKGYMRCQFDKFIKQNDTVCMALYKRQYPPWNPELFTGNL